MRDEKRIDRIGDLIKEIWHEHPDQRLGQLLSNYAWGHHVDPFYPEDDDIEANLRRVLQEKKEERLVKAPKKPQSTEENSTCAHCFTAKVHCPYGFFRWERKAHQKPNDCQKESPP